MAEKYKDMATSIYERAKEVMFNKYTHFQRYHSTHYLYHIEAEPIMKRDFNLSMMHLAVLSVCIQSALLSPDRFGYTFTVSDVNYLLMYRSLPTIKSNIAHLKHNGVIQKSKTFRGRWEFTPKCDRITQRYSQLATAFEQRALKHFGR